MSQPDLEQIVLDAFNIELLKEFVNEDHGVLISDEEATRLLTLAKGVPIDASIIYSIVKLAEQNDQAT